MRVLLTNNTLSARGGSELYVRDLALALLRAGHTPLAYSTDLGEVARELIAATVPVVDDLNALGEAPDIIHGHHHLDTMTALLHFHRTPAISFCHGWIPWEEAPPPRSPRILRYLAVDDVCRDRLIFQHGIPAERIQVLLNFADLERFRPRAALPAKPVRALVFSNSFAEGDANAIRDACQSLGISLDLMGIGSGNVSATPEARLGDYDLVFAKGRSALEALAVGCAVIVCDRAGLGGMVTTNRLAGYRRLNFGVRLLREKISVENIARELVTYSGSDAAQVSAQIRAEAGLEPVVDQLLSIYRDVIIEAGHLPEVDRGVESRATSGYLHWLSPVLKSRNVAERRAMEAARGLNDLKVVSGRMTEINADLQDRVVAQEEEIEFLKKSVAERDALADRVAVQNDQIELLNTRGAVDKADGARLNARYEEAQKVIADLDRASRQFAEARDARQSELDRIAASRAWRWIHQYGKFRERWLLRPLKWLRGGPAGPSL